MRTTGPEPDIAPRPDAGPGGSGRPGPTVAPYRMPTLPDSRRFVLALACGTALSLEAAPLRSPGTAAEGVTVTFLANEGVLLSGATAAGPRKVIIDGLFLEYKTGFALPAESTQTALRRANAPFDAVDLVLVTHRHGDHFHPAPVAAHLRANLRATLVTSRQVIDSLRAYLPVGETLAPRTLARTTVPGTRRREVINGVPVELLGVPHGGGRRTRDVEHLGYIVELGGRRVLHLGDTDLSETTFAALRLDTSRIDVALIPNWAVESAEGRAVIERWIRPRRIAAIHLPAADAERVGREATAGVPGAIALVRPLATWRW